MKKTEKWPAMNGIPREEHPRPQFMREDWLNLNGTWDFAFDFGDSGLERGYRNAAEFDHRITVPFCPESKLSGIEYRDFMRCVWYRRPLLIPEQWTGKRIILHFGGVDYETRVFIDGNEVGRHWGGMCSFEFDITCFIRFGGTHNLVVRAYDDTRLCGNGAGGSGTQPGGKQCARYQSYAASYSRVTGIWQTVWLEAVDRHGLRSCRIVPDFDGGRFLVSPTYYAVKPGNRLRVRVKDAGVTIAESETAAMDQVSAVLELPNPKPWSPESPFLYDLEFQLLDRDGRMLEKVGGYAGLRKIHIDGDRIFLNNKPLYLRMVLNQGYYPDGIWTAPDDAALKRDVELALRAGFNAERLHQKVFEERFHYWADRLGLLTWGEAASWGADPCLPMSARNFLPEWAETVVRDRNHPSIIAWVPLNETGQGSDRNAHKRLHLECYELCKMLDPTRPVCDASGFIHVRTDLWTVHDYAQDPAELKSRLSRKEDGTVFRNFPDLECEYRGEPYLVGEFGGIRWIPPELRGDGGPSWGYGNAPQTEVEFLERLAGLVGVLDSFEHLCGWCYTQLTDVEQEKNGIYNYDRSEKFDTEKIRNIFSPPGNRRPGSAEESNFAGKTCERVRR